MPVEDPMMLKTSLGEDLQCKSMDATEELGRLFEFNIEALADSGEITPEDLLGKPASVSVVLPEGDKRHFHGLVCAMGTEGADEDRFSYRLVLRPWLWLLTRRSDTRVFQDLTAQDILKKVFEPFSPDFEFQLTGTLPKYEYCVQYRETDFNFVSRLMEQEGIYYYFKHQADKHTMVIVNSSSAHSPNPVQDKFEFREVAGPEHDFEPIMEWRASKEIQTGQVVLRDFDFTAPKVIPEVKAKAPRKGASTKLEVYDYPGSAAKSADMDRYSQLRMEELQARYSRVDGRGAVRGLACGYRFDLKGHPRADQNKTYLLLSTRIELEHTGSRSESGETTCNCSFTAIEGTEIFRPRRLTPKPAVAGLHTAMVVGPSGQEIYTDVHGRAKVQFHWDRLGTNDDKSSCWVRVASPWAGQNWGSIALPRIGQEVVVDFLEGDPDRPLITGRVYNGEQKPPYVLPDHATVSTHKSRSSKSGAKDNFNELRFEDDKGSEYVWFQAEKDYHQLVKNDATLLVKGKQDRVVKLDLTEQIDGAVTTKIGKDSVTEVAGKHSLKVTGDMMTESSASISQKSGMKMDVKVGMDLGVDAAMNIHLKAGVNLVIESGVMITLKAGASSIVIGPAGISIVGAPMVMINSGGSAGSGGGANPKPVLAVKAPVDQKDPIA
ncbi:MAG: type VI secretion system tip protein VgrG [Rhodoferax sp.]|nr:type VI secretion system tip protein VgrG [Rhodoferax sp.]